MNPLEQLPDFENFKYQIAIRPSEGQLRAWDKFAECERRLAMYSFIEAKNDPSKAQYRVLLNDALSAFLLTLEATLEFVKDHFRRSNTTLQFKTWLNQQPQHDVLLKGLRTLRHFEAHVVTTPPHSAIVAIIGGSMPDGTSTASVSRTWRLPEIQLADLKQLYQPALTTTDLNDWNVLVAKSDLKSLLLCGLSRLRDILLAAEQAI